MSKPTIHPHAAFVVKLATDLVTAGAATTLEAAVDDVMEQVFGLNGFFESDRDEDCGDPDCDACNPPKGTVH